MKIISGGQTGVDLGALEFANLSGLQYGGWVPKGRTNENGEIPSKYTRLIETDTDNNIERTKLNVGSSDATLIITDGGDSPGTRDTEKLAKCLDKPFIIIDISQINGGCSERLRVWVDHYRPSVLNIAGPRASESPDIQRKTLEFLQESLPLNFGTISDYLANIRHWDTIRWIVPFWYISASFVVLAGIHSDHNPAKALVPIMFLVWSFVGFSCTYLVSRTMKYHDDQRDLLIKQFSRSALDPMSAVKFGSYKNGWSTATQWFWVLLLTISIFFMSMAIYRAGLVNWPANPVIC